MLIRLWMLLTLNSDRLEDHVLGRTHKDCFLTFECLFRSLPAKIAGLCGLKLFQIDSPHGFSLSSLLLHSDLAARKQKRYKKLKNLADHHLLVNKWLHCRFVVQHNLVGSSTTDAYILCNYLLAALKEVVVVSSSGELV